MAATPASDRCRQRLYRKYEHVIETNGQLDRSLVSFQANRKLGFYSWLKYKEGFSARLVEHLIDRYGAARATLLDPFAGVGTALFVARERGLNSIGIELMPVGFLAIESRLCAERISPEVFGRKVRHTESVDWCAHFDERYALDHIPITEGAFPHETDLAIGGYRAYCNQRIRDAGMRKLFEVAGLSVLEEVSYTRKDGQYLRWDLRSNKPRVTARFHKGNIKRFDESIHCKLRQMELDLQRMRTPGRDLFNGSQRKPFQGAVDLRRGSCLEILPKVKEESVDLIVTSPPYCNRYDYTRTYALELVYLGLGHDEVKRLRQALLSCTVENRAKEAELREMYVARRRAEDADRVLASFEQGRALQEVLEYLENEAHSGRLNNANIPRMVRNYFLEMCFVIFELSRVLKPGGRVVMVNDNVRYAGEEVPVDLILSEFAQNFGLRVEHIWTLPRGKGNSSQQMGVHGRTELRKCVYVWHKS